MKPVIHPIAIPNPFFEGWNQVYAISTDPVTLIDTGVATQTAFAALEVGLKKHRLNVHDIRRVVLTHKHIDHLGNAWRIQQASGAELWIHQSECDAIVAVDPDSREFLDLVSQRMREWQAPLRIDSESFSRVMPPWEIEPAEVRGLVDGQQLEFDQGVLEVIHTPGHTLGSICLAYERHLFTGDHVLPGMSPNVGGGDLAHRGLLRQFLASLERIKPYADGRLAMPGHGEPFRTLVPRCDALIGHHYERLEQIVAVLRDGPLTVYKIAQRLFGAMDDFHAVLGCAEVQAHLEWLTDHQQVRAISETGQFALA